jgi:hypothetical protein
MKIIDIKIPKDRELVKRDMCDSCYQVAIKLIKYQVGDREQKATRIERYCQKHFEMVIKSSDALQDDLTGCCIQEEGCGKIV